MTPMQIERARTPRPTQSQPMEKVIIAVAKAMAGVKRIAKDGRNKHDGYNFASVDSFFEAIGPVLADAELVVTMDETGCEGFERKGKYGPTSWLLFSFLFTVYHSSGQSLPPTTRTVEVIRSGAQAYGSAQSYALKQFLRALLMVPTGDADDADYGEKGDGPVSAGRDAPKPRQQAKQDQPEFEPRAAAERIGNKLSATETADALAAVWTSEKAVIGQIKAASPADYEQLVKIKDQRKNTLSVVLEDQIPY